MKIYDVPPYPGEKGKIGERFYNWLLKIPVIGTIILRYFFYDQWLDQVSDTWPYESLVFWAEHGDNKLREACLKGIRDRFPEGKAKQESLAQFMDRLRSNPSEVIGEKLEAAFTMPVVAELAEVVGALIFDSVMSMAIGGKEKLTPEMQEKIRRFIGTTVILSSAPKIAGTITEVLSLGQVDTLGDVMRDAYFNLGLGFITWQMTSPLIDGGIGRELRNQAQMIYRPERFSWAQLRDLYSLGRIGEPDVRGELQRLGWRDQDIDHMIALAYRTLSESKVVGMWSEGMLTDNQALSRLRSEGYSYSDSALILDYARITKANEQKEVLLSTARSAFINGLIAEDRFRAILRELRFEPEAIELEVAVTKLKMQEDERNLSASQLREAFLTNVITEVEAMSGLQTLHFRNDEAKKLIETWKRSIPLQILRVNKQTILLAWQRGVLTEAETRSKLHEIGYPPGDIDLIINTAKAEGATVTPTVSIGLLLEAVRSNVITVTVLEDQLRTKGYSDFDIQLISGIAQERKVLPLTTDAILDAFQAQVLTRMVAQEKLVELGMTIATASLMLDTREAERELRVPRVPLGVIMVLASEELISVDELEAILKDRRFPDSDIPLIVAASLYEIPTPLSQSLVERAYKQGVLSRDEAVDRLIVLGFTPVDANKVMLTIEQEMKVTQPRASVSIYVAATRDGIISADELRIKLLRIGLAPEDVELFVSLATFQPAIPAKMLTKTEILNAYEEFMFNRVDAIRRLEMHGYAIEDADLLVRMRRREPEDSEVHMLYQIGVLDFETALYAFLAIGYTEEQIDKYFEKWLREV